MAGIDCDVCFGANDPILIRLISHLIVELLISRAAALGDVATGPALAPTPSWGFYLPFAPTILSIYTEPFL